MDTSAASQVTHPRALGRTTGAQLPDELRMGPARLVVTDLDRSISWYRDVLGLQPSPEIETTADGLRVARLAAGPGEVAIELLERPHARRPGRTAGLYHVALLFPSRPELARAIERIAAAGSPVQGASDHGTHEALYLPDPDGNGLELAADRPAADWPNLADIEAIAPRALDLQDLLAAGRADSSGDPARAAAGLQVGHLHLHVGDIAQAQRYYVDAIGFDLVTRIDSAAFVSAGGYHHHLAFNTWRGEGAAPPEPDTTGLAHWSIVLPSVGDLDSLQARLEAAAMPADRRASDLLVTHDPWGIELQVRSDG